jgi:histidyl-tRNA synthetase
MNSQECEVVIILGVRELIEGKLTVKRKNQDKNTECDIHELHTLL